MIRTDKNLTYANLQILQIRRIMDDMLMEQENLKDSDIVHIALDIMRIFCDISAGSLYLDDEEWEGFLDAQKDEQSLKHFIRKLFVNSTAKNQLLIEIIQTTKPEELKKLFDKVKE